MKSIIREIDYEQARLDQKQKALAAQIEECGRKAEGWNKVKQIIVDYDLAPRQVVHKPTTNDNSTPSLATMVITVVQDHCGSTGQGLKPKAITAAVSERFKPVTSTKVAQALMKLKGNGQLTNVGGYYVLPGATQKERDAA
jgi:hypothetical protein